MIGSTITNKDGPTTIGFSLVGGGRDVVDKEQCIIQEFVQMAKPTATGTHALDDPARWGVDCGIRKIGATP